MLKKMFILMALLMLALTACKAASPESISSRVEAPRAMGGSSSDAIYGEKEESASMESSLSNEETSERMVIKNADLSIVVEEPSQSMDAIGKMAEDMGGFVVSSYLYQTETDNGVSVPRASITIRVPAENLNDALDQIKSGAGRILSENIFGEDVTREYTDLGSRLRNLENAETQLIEIMDNATETEDVLNVYNQLVNVQEEIEIIKGQMQYYEQSAALSAISVDIQANEAVQPLTIGGWQPVGVAKRAIQSLINALKFFGNTAIWLVLFLLPVVLILYFPVRWLWKGIKFLFKSKKSKKKGKEKEQTTEE
ncbi:MAG: DUF4349 domain-containing protein [Chloroflexota bacterium]|nr:DUF4349 domain-containing protein [Chloroflexota bacterium]